MNKDLEKELINLIKWGRRGIIFWLCLYILLPILIIIGIISLIFVSSNSSNSYTPLELSQQEIETMAVCPPGSDFTNSVNVVSNDIKRITYIKDGIAKVEDNPKVGFSFEQHFRDKFTVVYNSGLKQELTIDRCLPYDIPKEGDYYE